MTARKQPKRRARRDDRRCAEPGCGRGYASSRHIHYGNDVNSPLKHWFIPAGAVACGNCGHVVHVEIPPPRARRKGASK